MARESPPTRRVTVLLDAVVAQPRRAASLAELAGETGISKATALGILNELCDAGYLARDPVDKTYRLGAGLLRAGAAAKAGFAAVAAARPLLARLATELDAPCTASAVVDEQANVLARVGGSPAVAPEISEGARFAFAPPAGVMFVAWQSDPTVDAWLARTPIAGLAPPREELVQIVTSCRTLGYLVEGLGELDAGLLSALNEVADERVSARLADLIRRAVEPGQHYLLGGIVNRQRYDVGFVCAPVYNADAQMEFLASVLLMRPGLPGLTLKRHVEALLRTAEEITRSLGGRNPWSH